MKRNLHLQKHYCNDRMIATTPCAVNLVIMGSRGVNAVKGDAYIRCHISQPLDIHGR